MTINFQWGIAMQAALLYDKNDMRIEEVKTPEIDVKKLISCRLPLIDIQKGFDLASEARGLKNVICME